MITDLKFAVRQLTQAPGFTTIALLSVAIGIGANTAVFSLVDALVLRPLRFAHPNQLVVVTESAGSFGDLMISYPNFRDWASDQKSFEEFAAVRSQARNVVHGDTAERINSLQVSASYFKLLQVNPIAGRVFVDADDQAGAERVVLLSESLWRRLFNADSRVIGRAIILDNEAFTIAGVMPRAASFPRNVELWTPIGLPAPWTNVRDSHPGIYALGRLKSDVELAAARSEMDLLAARLAASFPDANRGHGAILVPMAEYFFPTAVRRSAVVLFAATGLVVSIACANVANLLLMRAAKRRGEFALRRALGARPTRILGQLLLESLLLAGLGASAGALIAQGSLTVIKSLLPAAITDFATFELNGFALTFAAGAAVFTGLIAGLAPMLVVAGVEKNSELSEIGRSVTAGAGRGLARRGLVICEVALALMLLVGAGLLIRSLDAIYSSPVGVDVDGVLVGDLSLNGIRYGTVEQRARFHSQIVENLRAIPGVNEAAVVAPLPLRKSGFQSSFSVAGQAPASPDSPQFAEVGFVTPDYFKALRIPVRAGQTFTTAHDGKAKVCIIDESFAGKYFKGDSLGRQIAVGPPDNWMTVIGVVDHVKLRGALFETNVQVYVPVTQYSPADATLLLRTSLEPMSLASAMREAVRRVDPEQPLAGIMTLGQVFEQTVAERKLAAFLLAGFALIALTLAAIGLYGVMSYGVTARTREIGVRMALGATVGDILRMVMAEGATLVLLGITLGLALSLGFVRLLSTILFKVSGTDAVTLIAAPALLFLVGLLAAWLPARRAANTDPMVILRLE